MPLRKVLDPLTCCPNGPHGRAVETLECGHTQRCPQDFIGETWAARRRCKKCLQHLPADIEFFEIRYEELDHHGSGTVTNDHPSFRFMKDCEVIYAKLDSVPVVASEANAVETVRRMNLQVDRTKGFYLFSYIKHIRP